MGHVERQASFRRRVASKRKPLYAFREYHEEGYGVLPGVRRVAESSSSLFFLVVLDMKSTVKDWGTVDSVVGGLVEMG